MKSHFLLETLLIILFFSGLIYCQPYYYTLEPVDDIGTVVMRIDMISGIKEQFLPDTLLGDKWSVSMDPSQMWIYLIYYYVGPIQVISCFDPSHRGEIPVDERVEWPDITYNYALDVFFVKWSNGEEAKYAAYDPYTFDLFQMLPRDLTSSSYSQDGRYIYKGFLDTTNNEPYLDIISMETETFEIVKRKKISEIGIETVFHRFNDHVYDIDLISCLSPTTNFHDRWYYLYNIQEDSSYTFIRFPQRSDGYLSADAKYIIIREVPLNPEPHAPDIPSGNIFIFDSNTGELRQRLQLPDGGEIFTYEDYPDKIYYYLPDEERAIIINTKDKTSSAFLLDLLKNSFLDISSRGGVSDNGFVNILNTSLERAGAFLAQDDSSNYWKELQKFGEMINEEFFDSTDNDGKNVSKEAWGSLYYNTKYITNQITDTVSQDLNFNIKLLNSQGNLLAGGTLQYYEGSWKSATDNGDGTFFVNTTQPRVSLRMMYEGGTQTLSNVSLADSVAIFRTVNAQVQLQNSYRNTLDTGRVQYYAGSWRDFGYTSNGIASKELLPGNYSFRMSYAYASNDKQQNIGADPTVVFQTVNTAIELRNSAGNLIDQGTVQYYSGAWRSIGTTTNGVVTTELLPNNYSFRMSLRICK